MARLRRAAMTLGPDRVLTCDLSSWYRVSRNGASEVTQSPIAVAGARRRADLARAGRGGGGAGQYDHLHAGRRR